MVKQNFTIDDPSSLISYQPPGAWRRGSDNFSSSYSNGGTFTVTFVRNATSSFAFNGTGVWIYGAKRDNHGTYTILMDGQQAFVGKGYAPLPYQFGAILYAGTNLTNGLHNVTLVNSWTKSSLPYIDIDWITWEADIGDNTDAMSTTTVEDSDPTFNYQPEGAWTADPPNVSSFHGGNGHGTFVSNAYVEYTFTTPGVALYGSLSQQSSLYTASVDGGPNTTFNGTRSVSNYQQMIYYADGLGSGQHTVRLTNNPATDGTGLTIDYAQEFTVPSVVDSERESGGSKGLGAGAIAGIVLGVLAALCTAAFVLFMFLRRRHQRRLEIAEAEGVPYTGVATSERGHGGSTAGPNGHQHTLAAVSKSAVPALDSSNHPTRGGMPVSNTSYARPEYGYQPHQVDPSSAAVTSTLETPSGVGSGTHDDSGAYPPRAAAPLLLPSQQPSRSPGELPPPNYNQAAGSIRGSS